MQIMAAVKSVVSQFSFKLSWVLAFKLERLEKQKTKEGREREIMNAEVIPASKYEIL